MWYDSVSREIKLINDLACLLIIINITHNHLKNAALHKLVLFSLKINTYVSQPKYLTKEQSAQGNIDLNNLWNHETQQYLKTSALS